MDIFEIFVHAFGSAVFPWWIIDSRYTWWKVKYGKQFSGLIKEPSWEGTHSLKSLIPVLPQKNFFLKLVFKNSNQFFYKLFFHSNSSECLTCIYTWQTFIPDLREAEVFQKNMSSDIFYYLIHSILLRDTWH